MSALKRLDSALFGAGGRLPSVPGIFHRIAVTWRLVTPRDAARLAKLEISSKPLHVADAVIGNQ
jgi:hypothetical protein